MSYCLLVCFYFLYVPYANFAKPSKSCLFSLVSFISRPAIWQAEFLGWLGCIIPLAGCRTNTRQRPRVCRSALSGMATGDKCMDSIPAMHRRNIPSRKVGQPVPLYRRPLRNDQKYFWFPGSVRTSPEAKSIMAGVNKYARQYLSFTCFKKWKRPKHIKSHLYLCLHIFTSLLDYPLRVAMVIRRGDGGTRCTRQAAMSWRAPGPGETQLPYGRYPRTYAGLPPLIRNQREAHRSLLTCLLFIVIIRMRSMIGTPGI